MAPERSELQALRPASARRPLATRQAARLMDSPATVEQREPEPALALVLVPPELAQLEPALELEPRV